MSKQSDGLSDNLVLAPVKSSSVCGELCVLGGIYCVYCGSASYTNYTDWK